MRARTKSSATSWRRPCWVCDRQYFRMSGAGRMVHRLASWAALALVAVLAACSAPAAAAGGPLYSVAAYDPARDAAADLAATLERARAEDKRVILEVGGEWCVWCKLLDAYVHDTPGYSARLAREFIIMKVNYSDE